MPVFKIHHVTRYRYDTPVKESIDEIRIYPYQCPEQEMLQHKLTITGNPDVSSYTDYWGNTAGVFNVMAPHKELTIDSSLLVRTTAPSEMVLNESAGFEALQKEMAADLRLLELAAAGSITGAEEISEIIRTIHDPQGGIAALVKESCDFIFNNFQYIKGITNVETTVDEILLHRSGVCQDFAHVLLQLLRTMRIPSRYVSGYICPNKNGMRGEGATHAWVEAWIPGHGWTGIDPTNNVWVTNKHVKLAVGRNFNDCSPIKGTFRGVAEQKLSVFVSVGYEDGVIFEEHNDVNRRAAAERDNNAAQAQQ